MLNFACIIIAGLSTFQHGLLTQQRACLFLNKNISWMWVAVEDRPMKCEACANNRGGTRLPSAVSRFSKLVVWVKVSCVCGTPKQFWSQFWVGEMWKKYKRVSPIALSILLPLPWAWKAHIVGSSFVRTVEVDELCHDLLALLAGALRSCLPSQSLVSRQMGRENWKPRRLFCIQSIMNHDQSFLRQVA